MTTAEDAIRARRKLTNRLIAAHQAQRLVPFFDKNVLVITGDGSHLIGATAMIAAFAAQFAEPGFGAFVRTTTQVKPDAAAGRAAETGDWVATRTDAGHGPSGTYLTVWRKVTGQWIIESEVYVTLSL